MYQQRARCKHNHVCVVILCCLNSYKCNSYKCCLNPYKAAIQPVRLISFSENSA